MRVELAKRAVRDLRALSTNDYKRVRAGLQQLANGAENLDMKALTDAKPWLELRVGEHRLLLYLDKAQETYVVARIVKRRDLERAVRT